MRALLPQGLKAMRAGVPRMGPRLTDRVTDPRTCRARETGLALADREAP